MGTKNETGMQREKMGKLQDTIGLQNSCSKREIYSYIKNVKNKVGSFNNSITSFKGGDSTVTV